MFFEEEIHERAGTEMELLRAPCCKGGRKLKIPRGVLLLFFVAQLSAISLWAVDPSRLMTQYAHSSWRMKDGVFSDTPRAIAQTADGYVWVGTRSGLLRFDGVRFVPFISSKGEPSLSVEITALWASKDGSLWIATSASRTQQGLIHWAHGDIVSYMRAPGYIGRFMEDHNGAVWMLGATNTGEPRPLCQILGEALRCYGKDEGLPASLNDPESLVEDKEGNFWIGTDTGLVRWKSGSSVVYKPKALDKNTGMDGIDLAAAPDGSLWVGSVGPGHGLGLQRLVRGALVPFSTPEFVGSTLNVSTLLLDRHNVLWVGTHDRGIYRVYGHRVDHFSSQDGLSSDRVSRLYEDHEGNLWVVTSAGVDNFRDLQVATFSTREGVSTAEVDSVLASRDGTLWIGGSHALCTLRQNRVSCVNLDKNAQGIQTTSLLEDHSGQIWVGIDNTMSIRRDGRFVRINRRDASPVGFITGMAEDVDHSVWVEDARFPKTLLRIRDGRVQEELPVPEMPAARKVAADPGGGIWLGLMSGDLARYRHGRIETFHFEHSMDSTVEQVTVEADGTVYGATSFGLEAWRDGKQQILNDRNGLPCNRVRAFVSDNNGSLWLSMSCGLVEIAKAELQTWWQHPDATLQVRTFDATDGVQTGPAYFDHGTAKTPDGRLWFTNNIALQMIDPAHLLENTVLPPVHIESILADRKNYSPDADLHLPPLTRDLEIDYTALSFVAPQKVRFRYMLEGRDHVWEDPGTRRQAFYSDLGPGAYRFRVIACNNDGHWNDVGASLTFRVMPAWYQTMWFRSLCAALSLLFIWCAYRLRVRQIAAALSARFDERLAERTRLARELHDTFLQTVQGSKMVADDALDVGAGEDRMRQALEKLSRWLGQAADEGRAALHSLRVSTREKNHLSEALQRATEDHQLPSSMTVAFSVIGDPKDLHPIVRDEVYRIGYEAIRNTAAHSKASRLEIDLRYANDLSLRIKDNGVGIDPAFSDEGRPGHFGLQGMRERAARIHCKLTIVSSTNAGTEITLVVPGNVVYRNVHPTAIARLKGTLRRLLGRSDRI